MEKNNIMNIMELRHSVRQYTDKKRKVLFAAHGILRGNVY